MCNSMWKMQCPVVVRNLAVRNESAAITLLYAFVVTAANGVHSMVVVIIIIIIGVSVALSLGRWGRLLLLHCEI